MSKKSARQFVADRIKELRSEQSITQAELARRAGINRSYLADIEMGNRNFGIDTLEKITQGLDVDTAAFFANVPKRK